MARIKNSPSSRTPASSAVAQRPVNIPGREGASVDPDLGLHSRCLPNIFPGNLFRGRGRSSQRHAASAPPESPAHHVRPPPFAPLSQRHQIPMALAVVENYVSALQQGNSVLPRVAQESSLPGRLSTTPEQTPAAHAWVERAARAEQDARLARAEAAQLREVQAAQARAERAERDARLAREEAAQLREEVAAQARAERAEQDARLAREEAAQLREAVAAQARAERAEQDARLARKRPSKASCVA